MTSALPPLAQACSGALGSAAANSITYPLDLVAAKLQTTNSRRLRGIRGAVRLLRHIVRTEGVSGLYDGLGADTASTIVSNFLYFYFYTLLHALVARRRASSHTPLLQAVKHAVTAPTKHVLLGVPTELAVGFVAGVASRAVSTPLSVVTVRLQTMSDSDSDDSEPPSAASQPKPPPTFAQVARAIYKEDGLSAFWAGFRPTLPLCLTPALTLLLFQLLSRLRLGHASPSASPRASKLKVKARAPSAAGAFLSGASANALALTLLYPLLLAKVRVQAARGKGHGGTSMTDVWAQAVREDAQ